MPPHMRRKPRGQRHLRQTKRPRVRIVGRSNNPKWFDHGIAHVGRDGAEAHVHVDEAFLVAGEPAGLDGDGTAGDGPFGSIG